MVRDVVDENGGDYTCNNKIFYLIRFMTLVIVFGMQNMLYEVKFKTNDIYVNQIILVILHF